MASLTLIANFILNFYSSLINLLTIILSLGSYMGQLIYNGIRVLLILTADLMVNLKSLVVVISEDYYLFVQDFGVLFSKAFKIIYNGILVITNGFLNSCMYAKLGCLSILESLSLMACNFNRLLYSILLNLQEGMFLLKKTIVLLGASIWFGITIIPLSIISVIHAFFLYLEAFFYKMHYFTILGMIKIQYYSNSVLRFFFDVPLDSFSGLLIGSFILYVTAKNLNTIISLTSRTFVHIYNNIEAFGTFLWTGNFNYERQRQEFVNVEHIPHDDGHNNVNDEAVNVNPVQDENTLCVVCQDKPREIVVLPCKHMCLCEDCCVVIRRMQRSCPVCRTLIRRIIKVYR